jgi:hypothetical protein
VIPQRVTQSLAERLSSSRLQKVIVVHSNHANEIDNDVIGSLQRLDTSGTQMLNQSVLLKGVNDSADALVDLSQRLLDAGVLPYYLHQLDPVIGAAHFEVPIEHGRQLIAAIRARLPGYAGDCRSAKQNDFGLVCGCRLVECFVAKSAGFFASCWDIVYDRRTSIDSLPERKNLDVDPIFLQHMSKEDESP